ncbi:MAG TPA: DoxX family protein [Flavitalea sp.]|nr:DoxX family protein [Flavitalea sp.]
MGKLFSTSYSASTFNIALLILRITGGIFIIPHGYDKFVHYQQYKPTSLNFLHLGSGPSLALNIFAEVICGALVILGLFTRLATIPLLINMAVVVLIAEQADFFGKAEHGAMFFGIFLTILLTGPGKISVDGMIK